MVSADLQNNARKYDRAYRGLPQVLITYLPGRKVRELLKISLGEQLVQLRPPYLIFSDAAYNAGSKAIT